MKHHNQRPHNQRPRYDIEVASPTQMAEALGISRSTLDKRKAEGLFDGTFKKRGKRVFFNKPKALEAFFNRK